MIGLSETMRRALDYAAPHGALVRYPGGYWAKPGWRRGDRPWFGNATVDALASRQQLHFTRWRTTEDGRSIPVRAERPGCVDGRAAPERAR